jgi:hypothetical protein
VRIKNSKPSSILDYGLETIPGLDHGNGRYPLHLWAEQRGGVAILCRTDLQSRKVLMYWAANDNINSVFLHLLDNPRLCDRSAAEMSSRIGNSGWMAPTSPGIITMVESEGWKPRHTRAAKRAGDLNERLWFCIGNWASLWSCLEM